MPSDLPAHASPALYPQDEHGYPQLTSADIERSRCAPPPSFYSPTFEPAHPITSASSDAADILLRKIKSVHVDAVKDGLAAPSLLPELPIVECAVRARIPTTTGTEMFLHVYTNNVDNKEHLAIVFGENPKVRSRSLYAERPGESEADRMQRGAYEGKLFPGRTTSKPNQLPDEAKHASGSMSPMLQSMQKRKLHNVSRETQHTSPAAYPAHVRAHDFDDFPGFEESPLHKSSLMSSFTLDTPEDDSSHIPELQDQSLLYSTNDDIPLVRIHSECYTGETVWSARCDCGEQLDEAARLMSAPADPLSPSSASGGVIIYLRQEGRGIGLGEKLKAYNLQDLGYDTFEANLLLRHPADARSYGLATAMLVDLGLGGEQGIRLLTNNPDKIRAVEGPNREVTVRERVAMVPLAWSSNGEKGIHSKEVEGYLSTKVRYALLLRARAGIGFYNEEC